MIRTIVYISNSVKLIEENTLNKLFLQTMLNNTLKNITGVLIYKEGTFIQILEGKAPALNNLFKKIQTDVRHNNITKILDRMNAKRLFGKFHTVLSSRGNARQLVNLETFLTDRADSSHSNTLLGLLHPFLNKSNNSMNALSC
ncbi:MAG: BLUF domain-containing protein [Flavobacteriaceae bacterium]|nr:BLUF domain-containing protein [Flavobacteriaceae bacterium]